MASIGSRYRSRPSRSMPTTSNEKAKDYQFQFPTKLYEMLEIVSMNGLSHVVTWLPDGRSFQVNDPKLFMETVAPQFFKASKFRSFTRQLNLWNFSRIANSQAWRHDYFIRGKPELISEMKRTRIKGVRKRAPSLTPNEEAYSLQLAQKSSDISQTVSVGGRSEEDAEEASVSDATLSSSGSITSCRLLPSTEVEYGLEYGMVDVDLGALFSERISGQGNDYADSVGLLEPLPMQSNGILDGNRNNLELAEFGQLLGRLIMD